MLAGTYSVASWCYSVLFSATRWLVGAIQRYSVVQLVVAFEGGSSTGRATSASCRCTTDRPIRWGSTMADHQGSHSYRPAIRELTSATASGIPIRRDCGDVIQEEGHVIPAVVVLSQGCGHHELFLTRGTRGAGAPLSLSCYRFWYVVHLLCVCAGTLGY